VYVSVYICMYVCMDVRLYPSVLSSFPRLDFRFRDICVFYGERSSVSRPTPNLEDRVSLLVWIIPLGDPTSSYATAGIALRVIWPRKPLYYVKVVTIGGEITLLMHH
jgi:hypothetical protein